MSRKHESRRKHEPRRAPLSTASPATPALPVAAAVQSKGTFSAACYHSTPTHVFDIGPSKIWAGIEAYIPNFPEPALIVDCSNFFGATKLLVPPGFEGLIKHSFQLPVLQIPWPDGDLPEVKPEFWPELVKLLPAGNVYVCCAGGHGRTGTALAALRLSSIPATTVREAILQVRKLHCPEAIETEDQIRYLYDLGTLIGGLDMVNDCGLPRPRGTWQAMVSGQTFAQRGFLRGWSSVGPEGYADADGRPTSTDGDAGGDTCTDNLDADMLEHWPLSRTMTEEEIQFYRDNGTWPTAVWDEYDKQA